MGYSDVREQWAKRSAIGDQDPGYKAVCALVRAWQQGEGPTAEDVANKAVEVAGGDEEQARDVMRRALDWWRYMQGYVDRNGEPLKRSAVAGLEIKKREFHDPFDPADIASGLATMSDDGVVYEAYVNGSYVGKLMLRKRRSDNGWQVYRVQVYEDHQRQGIATALMERARADLGQVDHAPMEDRTDAGKGWSRAVGQREISGRSAGIRPMDDIGVSTTGAIQPEEIRVGRRFLHSRFKANVPGVPIREQPPQEMVVSRVAKGVVYYKQVGSTGAGFRADIAKFPEFVGSWSDEHTAAKWVFDVDYATDKNTLMAGEVVAGTQRVTVDADGYVDARLTAEQMVAATGNEPTDARLVL